MEMTETERGILGIFADCVDDSPSAFQYFDDEDDENFDLEAFRAEEDARAAYEEELYAGIHTPETLEEHEEYTRQKKRLAMCGHPSERIDPTNANIIKFTYHCRLWRPDFDLVPCQYCFEARVKQFRDEAIRAIYQTHGTVRYLVTTDAIADDLITEHELSKKNYRRYPGQNGETLLLIDNEYKIGQQLTKKEVDIFDWLNFANTPDVRRTSGKIGMAVAPAKPEKDETVGFHCRAIQVDGLTPEQHKIAQIETFATLLEKDTEPTAETLQPAIDLFERTYISNLRKAGGQVGTFMLASSVEIKRIDSWLKEIQINLQRLDPTGKYFDRELLKKPLPAAK